MLRPLFTALVALFLVVSPAIGNETDREIIWSEPARYPEGPMVRDGSVYWAEMRADVVRRRAESGVATVFAQAGCGPTSVKPAGDADLWVLCHLSDEVLRVDTEGAVKLRLRRDGRGVRLRNPNDAAPDGRGGLFVSLSGRFAAGARPTGRVVHVTHEGNVRTVVGRLHYANGLSYDAQAQQLLVSEHLARKVWRLHLDREFSPLSKQLFLDLDALSLTPPSYPLAGPDGIAVLPDGNLLVAEYGSARLLEVSADGDLVAVVDAPAAFVTNAVLAGESLVITATTVNDREPFSGSVTAVAWPPVKAVSR